MATHSLNNISRTVSEIQNQMTLDKIRLASRRSATYEDLQENTLLQITRLVGAIERNLTARNLTAADLAIRSRRGYQWLKFLSDPNSLYAHLDALQRINLYLAGRRGNPPLQCSFALYHQGSLYKVRHSSSQVEIVAQESFLNAPDRILKALIGIALDPSCPEDRTSLRDYTFSTEYQQVRRKLEYIGVPPGSFSAGEVHHLEHSFQRVNQAYFQGNLAQPHLAWSGRLSRRKFGHYQWDTDTVVVSSSLDQASVPEMVVDFVIYHELLHKKIGAKQAGQNRIAHSREFREAEAQFSEAAKAREYLNRIAKKRARSKR